MRTDQSKAAPVDVEGVLDVLPGVVLLTHADGQADFISGGWREFTGLDLAASQGLSWQSAIHPDDVAPMMEAWNASRLSGAAPEIDVRLRRVDGEHRWFAFRPSRLPQAGQDPERWCWYGRNADEGPETDGRIRRLWDMLPFRSGFLNTQAV